MGYIVYIVFIAIFLTLPIFFIKRRHVYVYALFLSISVIALTSFAAIKAFNNSTSDALLFNIGTYKNFLQFSIDKLSAFFILITNFAVLTGILYSRSYLFSKNHPPDFKIALHYFSYIWLHFSMLGVLMLRDGLSFLISWELMAISSFLLVLYEGEKRQNLKTAVNYLVQMHIGFVLLLAAFLICEFKTGIMSFDALSIYFANNGNIGLFFLFFAGFAMKAGFLPFHTWLPEAHPAAPSHVSGVMSGVMLKMGIYGILRVVMHLKTDIYEIGIIIIIISALSGLYGITMAVTQKDVKRILAYSSIENIGIIGIGIGLGIIGLHLHNSALILLGFVGSLLHVLNHSLFKPLLFFSAGSVYKQYKTRDINNLGGVIKKMPVTSVLFLFGAIAVSGLPPLNGFISEIIIFSGLFKGLSAGGFNLSILMILIIVALALIGGVAIFSFTRFFGVAFLGNQRNKEIVDAKEISLSGLLPQIAIVVIMLMIGLIPLLFVNPIVNLVSDYFSFEPLVISLSLVNTLKSISLISLILIVLVVLLFYIRKMIFKRRIINQNETWGCGYTLPSAKLQYTGTSYANNFLEIAKPIIGKNKSFAPIAKTDFFPEKQKFETLNQDVTAKFFNKITAFLMLILKNLARLQTGYIQHYILYTFIYIIIIFILLYLGFL